MRTLGEIEKSSPTIGVLFIDVVDMTVGDHDLVWCRARGMGFRDHVTEEDQRIGMRLGHDSG